MADTVEMRGGGMRCPAVISRLLGLIFHRAPCAWLRLGSAYTLQTLHLFFRLTGSLEIRFLDV